MAGTPSCAEVYQRKRHEAEQNIAHIDHFIDHLRTHGDQELNVFAIHDGAEQPQGNHCLASVGAGIANTFYYNRQALYYHVKYCLDQSRLGKTAIAPSDFPRESAAQVQLCSRSVLSVLTAYPIGFVLHNALSIGHSVHDAAVYSFGKQENSWLKQSNHLGKRITAGFIGFALTLPAWMLFLTFRTIADIIPAGANQFKHQQYQAMRMPSRYSASQTHRHLGVIAHALLLMITFGAMTFSYFKPLIEPHFIPMLVASLPLWPLFIGRNIGLARHIHSRLMIQSLGLERTADQGFERNFFSPKSHWLADILALPGAIIGCLSAFCHHNYYASQAIYIPHKAHAYAQRYLEDALLKLTAGRLMLGLPGVGAGYLMSASAYIRSACHQSRMTHRFYIHRAKRLGLIEINDDRGDTDSQMGRTLQSEMSDASRLPDDNSYFTHYTRSKASASQSRRSQLSGSHLAGSILHQSLGKPLETIESGGSDSDDDGTELPSIPKCVETAAHVIGFITSIIPSTWISSKMRFEATYELYTLPYTKRYSEPQWVRYNEQQQGYLKTWRAKPGALSGHIAGFSASNTRSFVWGIKDAWYTVSSARNTNEANERVRFTDPIFGFGGVQFKAFRRKAYMGLYSGKLIALIPAYLISVGGEYGRALGGCASYPFNRVQDNYPNSYHIRLLKQKVLKSKQLPVQLPAYFLAAVTFGIPIALISTCTGLAYRACCKKCCEKRQTAPEGAVAPRETQLSPQRTKKKAKVTTQELWMHYHRTQNVIEKNKIMRRINRREERARERELAAV